VPEVERGDEDRIDGCEHVGPLIGFGILILKAVVSAIEARTRELRLDRPNNLVFQHLYQAAD